MAGAITTVLARAMVCSRVKTARLFTNVRKIAAIMVGARARDVTAMQVRRNGNLASAHCVF